MENAHGPLNRSTRGTSSAGAKRVESANGNAVEAFVWDTLFFLVFHVDNGGLVSWTEPLFDHHGDQIFELFVDANGGGCA